MKKTILIALLAIATALCCALGLSACDVGNKPEEPNNPPTEHSHSWSVSWESNETHHWHNCTAVGCTVADNTQKDGYAEHDFSGGDCVCGKVKPAPVHDHDWSASWESDDTYHWHNCIAADCTVENNTQKDGYGAHTYGTDNKCNVCSKRNPYMPTAELSYASNNGMLPEYVTGYVVAGIGKATETDIVIPNSYEGKPVVGIRHHAFSGCSQLTSITMPDSVGSIGDEAFSGCSGLTSITIPDKVTSIGEYAFSGCSGLTSIEIPRRVSSIGRGAFYNCSGLTSISIPDRAYDTSIGSYAFSGCSQLTSITIPDKVTIIWESAFSGCSSLESITLPFVGNSKKTSSDTNQYPLGYIFGIKSYTGGVATKQYYYGSSTSSTTYTTFYIPSSLKSVTITGGDILYGAFYNCGGLTGITISGGVTSIRSGAFYNCRVTSVTISGGVKDIGGGTFLGCSGLTDITISDSVTSISHRAFEGCSSLESITLPFVGYSIKTSSDKYQYPLGYIFGTSSYEGGVATQQYYYDSSTSNTTNTTYYIPSSLKSVTITGGNILYGAFYNCSGLTNITIPDGVTSIGDRAFYRCSGLTSITIPDSVTSMGVSAFSGCSGLTSISVDSNNTVYYSEGNCIIKRESKTLILGCKNSVISDSVTSIGSYAFSGCSGLTSITIPDSVTSIGSYAFSGCSGLTSITIPDSVTSIGSYAFSGCSGIMSITIPDSVTSVGVDAFSGTPYYKNADNWEDGVLYIGNHFIKAETSITGTYEIKQGSLTIAGSAFYNCKGLTGIIIPDSVISIGNSVFQYCSGLTSIIIPDGVTTIGDYAFRECSGLTSIVIPDSVTTIGDYAFRECSGLTEIDFEGTKAQWSAIQKGSGWNSNTGNYIVNCTDGDITKS